MSDKRRRQRKQKAIKRLADVKSRRGIKKGELRKLEKRVTKLSQKTNQRLKSLERHHKKGTWASKKLIQRASSKKLKAWSTLGRIKPRKGMTQTELKQLEHALQQFLESSTSTHKGIKSAKNSVVKSIQTTLNDEGGYNLSDFEAETFYDMLSDNDFEYFNDKIGASTMWALIEDSIEMGDSKERFLKRVERYAMTLNDLDARERAQRIYDKYLG